MKITKEIINAFYNKLIESGILTKDELIFSNDDQFDFNS